MPSSVFAGGSPSQIPPMGNNGGIGGMLKAFNEFKKLMAGKDPKAAVMQLLTNGQMSQQQFAELKDIAQNLSGILK